MRDLIKNFYFIKDSNYLKNFLKDVKNYNLILLIQIININEFRN